MTDTHKQACLKIDELFEDHGFSSREPSPSEFFRQCDIVMGFSESSAHQIQSRNEIAVTRIMVEAAIAYAFDSYIEPLIHKWDPPGPDRVYAYWTRVLLLWAAMRAFDEICKRIK